MLIVNVQHFSKLLTTPQRGEFKKQINRYAGKLDLVGIMARLLVIIVKMGPDARGYGEPRVVLLRFSSDIGLVQIMLKGCSVKSSHHMNPGRDAATTLVKHANSQHWNGRPLGYGTTRCEISSQSMPMG